MISPSLLSFYFFFNPISQNPNVKWEMNEQPTKKNTTVTQQLTQPTQQINRTSNSTRITELWKTSKCEGHHFHVRSMQQKNETEKGVPTSAFFQPWRFLLPTGSSPKFIASIQPCGDWPRGNDHNNICRPLLLLHTASLSFSINFIILENNSPNATNKRNSDGITHIERCSSYRCMQPVWFLAEHFIIIPLSEWNMWYQ